MNMNRLLYNYVVGIFFSLLITVRSSVADETHLKVHFFPVGEGDATIVECYEKGGNVSLTLINAGSISKEQDEIQTQYFKFLAGRLGQQNYSVKNVILTNADPKFYNFIEPLILLKRSDLMKIDFYLGGQRISYVILDEIFKVYDNVYEFTRENEFRGRVSSCGHYGSNKTFYNCVKRDLWGPIESSDETINVCDGFEISVLAANYGFADEYEEEIKKGTIQRRDKNSLLLKLTPTGQSSPSILMGDFENEGYNTDTSDDYYTFVRDAHAYFTDAANAQSLSGSLTKGLASNVMKLPENGAITDATIDSKFYSQFVRPTYVVISSGIDDTPGHPKCEVLEALSKYMSTISISQKNYQCHPLQPKTRDYIKVELGSNNIFQTSSLDLDDYVHGKIQHHLITMVMTSSEIEQPTSSVIYHVDRY